MSTTIYGASDDLIEVEGDIREEFNVLSEVEEGGLLIATSDGTVLRTRYDEDGFWRLTVVVRGTCPHTKTEGTDPENDYSDKITFEGDLTWVALATQWARR